MEEWKITSYDIQDILYEMLQENDCKIKIENDEQNENFINFMEEFVKRLLEDTVVYVKCED